MATYYVQLSGGQLRPKATLAGGIIYPSSGGGGGGGSMQVKSVSYTPSETAISASVTPDVGYDGLSRVNVSVGAIDPTYVGSEVPRKSSSDLTASGATVTAPAGYYENAASKAIPNASQALTDAYVQSSGDLEVELNTSSGGYVANGNQYLQFENFTTPVPTTTYYATSSDQVIMSQNSMAFGAQTIKGVTTNNLLASNIKKDVVVEVGDSADPDRIVSVTGTYEGGGGGGVTWGAIGDNTITPSVRNLFYGLAQSAIEWGEFTLTSTPNGSQTPLFTLQNITAPCRHIVFIDKEFYQGIPTSTLPNSGGSEVVSFLWLSRAFINPAKEAQLASAYPCYGAIGYMINQTSTGNVYIAVTGAPFDNSTQVGRGYFQWDGQTLKWRAAFGNNDQYNHFARNRAYIWIAF